MDAQALAAWDWPLPVRIVDRMSCMLDDLAVIARHRVLAQAGVVAVIDGHEVGRLTTLDPQSVGVLCQHLHRRTGSTLAGHAPLP